MPRLKNRQMQIPNGLGFYLPQLPKAKFPRGSSFTVLCDAVEVVVKANRALAQRHGWPTDRPRIEDWVDRYNATVCARLGWDNYINSDEASVSPKTSPRHQVESLASLKAAAAAAKDLVRGAKTLTEWVESREDAVGAEEALRRAQICAQCPKNSQSDLTSWFTIPAAELIKRQVEKSQARHLSTPQDDNLNICTACYCPLKLKVWVPLDWIKKRLSPEQTLRLKDGKNCWILNESP
jgi:hypothetical protein